MNQMAETTKISSPVEVVDIDKIMELFFVLHDGYNGDTAYFKCMLRNKRDGQERKFRAAVATVHDVYGSVGGDSKLEESEKVFATGITYNDAACALFRELKKMARRQMMKAAEEAAQVEAKLAKWLD